MMRRLGRGSRDLPFYPSETTSFEARYLLDLEVRVSFDDTSFVPSPPPTPIPHRSSHIAHQIISLPQLPHRRCPPHPLQPLQSHQLGLKRQLPLQSSILQPPLQTSHSGLPPLSLEDPRSSPFELRHRYNQKTTELTSHLHPLRPPQPLRAQPNRHHPVLPRRAALLQRRPRAPRRPLEIIWQIRAGPPSRLRR